MSKTVEQFSEVRIVETDNRSTPPAPTNEANARGETTSNYTDTKGETGEADYSQPAHEKQHFSKREA